MVVLTKRAEQIFASVDESGAARTISETEVAVWGTELELGQAIVEQNSQLANSPLVYGAKGNGVINDAAKYALAEVANDNIFLPSNTVFNLGSAVPSKPVYGPGAVKIGANIYGGAQLTYDPYRTQVWLTPESFYRKTGGFPAGNQHLNVIISPAGPSKTTSLNRTTIVGNANAISALSLDRVEIFGDGAGRRMMRGERNSLFGSISGEQLGAQNTSDHNYWNDAGGFVPGQAGWNYQGLETDNPGISAKIASWIATNPFAVSNADVRAIVGMGRDSWNAALIGQNSTALGYLAGAGNLKPEGMTLVGTQANQRGIFTTNSTIGGYMSAQKWQEGTRGTGWGYQNASSLVRGSQWTAIGAFAGSEYTDLDDSILLGFGAGNGLGLTQGNGILAIGLSGNPLVSGNLKASGGSYSGPNLGVNISPPGIKGTLHVRTSDFGTAAAAHVNADDLVVESSGNTGISIRSEVAGFGSLFFARPGVTNRAGITYNHSAEVLTLRSVSGDRVNISSAGIGFNGNAALTKPTVSGAKGSNAALASLLTALSNYGLITDSTTA